MGLDWSIITPPEHLQLFNVHCLSRALRRCGFRRIRVESRGLNVYALRDHLRPPRRREADPRSRSDNAFRLNEQLSRSPIRRSLKEVLNVPFRVLHCGDSLRVWAVKPF